MQNASTTSARKKLTAKRRASIAFLLLAVFVALICWAFSMAVAGRPHSNNEVLDAIVVSNLLNATIGGGLTLALIGVVLALFDLADKQPQ